MKRSWEPRGTTPPPTIPKMSSKVENPRVESSTSRSQISSYRRSRSPARKSSLSPAPKRSNVLREKRRLSRSRRGESLRSAPKRSRVSTRSRSHSRRASKEKPSSYACTSTKESVLGRGSSRSAHRNERYRSRDKYLVDRPSFRGPEKNITLDRDSLKKIVVNMRDTPTGNDNIKREIVNPEDITVVRRAAASGRRVQYRDDTRNRMKRKRSGYETRDRCCDHGERAGRRNTSEGSRPIFDRDEIKNSTRKFEEDEHGTRRIFLDSPPHSARKPSSNEDYRSRNSYYDDDRHARDRDPSGSRAPKDYSSQHYDRHRDERSRYSRRSRSRERSRDFGHERRDKYDDRDYRRSRIRGRSSVRPFRRHLSPIEMRRMNGRKLRSPEREVEPRRRDKELPPESEYPGSDYPPEPHGYFEGEPVEGQVPPPSRGGGHSLPFRGRGSGMPMVIRGGPPVRPVRAVLIPRVPGMARRLPFPPRLIRPIVRPVIRVIAPVIRVRSPSVIPVRHPAIPLPFQCEAFR